MIRKQIVYFDMDNVLVDFKSGIEYYKEYGLAMGVDGNYDEIPGIFKHMKPYPEMVDLFNKMALDDRFDVYILSTAPWENPSAWKDKVSWVKKYIPLAYKRLNLSHNKNLLMGDYLIDDRTKNGADKFKGELIQYGTEKFPDAQSVEKYLKV